MALGEDYDSIYEAADIISGCSRMDQLAGCVIEAVNCLIPSDIVAYGEVDVIRKRATTLANHRASCSMPLTGVWSELTLAEPVLSYWKGLRAQQSVRFSDVVSVRALERFEIFQRYYRPLGVSHQLVGPISIHDGVITSVGLSRADRDFSDRERDLLDGFLRSLARTHHRLSALERRPAMITHVGDLMFTHHFLLSPSGLLVSGSSEGLEWLERFCGPLDTGGSQLPAALAQWVVDTIASPMRQPKVRCWGANVAKPATTHLEHVPERGGFVLTLTRREPIEQDLIQILFGVNERQAEATALLIRGMSNARIARHMKSSKNNKPISTSTVKGHLDVIYRALGMEGAGRAVRQEAITKILERIEYYVLHNTIPRFDM